MTIEQALKQFAEWGSGRYAPSTISTYTTLIMRFIEHAAKGVDLNNVDITNVITYHKYLKQKGYHDATIAYSMISLRQFFRFLFLRRLIGWDYQLISVPKYVHKSFIPVAINEAKEMINGIDHRLSFKLLRDRCILMFLYASGVRVSELCNIQLSQVNPDRLYSNIVSKKNRQVRMIFWDKLTAKVLKEYILDRKLYCQNDEFLFISLSGANKGGGLSTRSVQRLVTQYRPNNRKITPHSFRHGLGMRAVQADISLRYVQKILGHKNLNSSQVYLDVYDRDVVRAYRKIAC